MLLSDLPLEILELSLLYCQTPSFLQVIRTCKTIFRVAESSRKVLLHHLEQVPGITADLQDSTISTHELFLTLRRRGAAHLIGSDLSADSKSMHMEYGTIDQNASWLADDTYAVVLRGSCQIRLYEVLHASCKLKSKVMGTLPSPLGFGKVLKVVTVGGTTFTLFSYSSITGAGRSQEDLESSRRPMREGDGPNGTASPGTDHLSLGLSDIDYFIAVHEYNSGEFACEDNYFCVPAPAFWLGKILVPIDLAVSGPLACAILWDIPQSVLPSIYATIMSYTANKVPTAGNIVTYKSERCWPLWDRPNEEKEATLKSKRRQSLYRRPVQAHLLPGIVTRALQKDGTTELPRSVAFALQGQYIKIFAPGSVIPFHVTSLPVKHDDEAPPRSNVLMASYNPWGDHHLHNFAWSLTTTFYSDHVTQPLRRLGTDSGREVEKMCITSYLCLATAKVPRLWARFQETESDVEVMCILRAVEKKLSRHCSHEVRTDQCLRRHNSKAKVVARLWGWQPSGSSLAGERQMACCDTRIAIAEWDRIFIWSLDPRALLDEADDSASPEAFGESFDNLDSETSSDFYGRQPVAGEKRKLPEWTYPKIYDENMETWYVELKPIVLHTSKSGRGKNGSHQGADVIRQLMWKDPKTLVVRTGGGLQIWSLGSDATGKRTGEVLEGCESRGPDELTRATGQTD